MKKLNISHLVLIGLFAAILAVMSQMSIPLPSGVPVTLQTFAVALCGFVLGSRHGALSVLVYLLLGAVGLPVFAGFIGGAGILFGVTGGFLFGFLAMAALCGSAKLWLSALGLALCHLLGIAQFSLISGTPLAQSALLVSVPYLLKDIVSVVAAYLSAQAVRRGLRAARFAR